MDGAPPVEAHRRSADTGGRPAGSPADDLREAAHRQAGTELPQAVPGAETVPGAPRIGAHAQPYMDADGALHNLRPIGRLEVSGSDVEPRQAEKNASGGSWFGAKPNAEAADETAAAMIGAETATDGPASTSAPAPSSSEPASEPASATLWAATSAASPQVASAVPATDGEHAASEVAELPTRTRVRRDDSRATSAGAGPSGATPVSAGPPNDPGPARPAAGESSAAPGHVVIDLTDLFGSSVAASPAAEPFPISAPAPHRPTRAPQPPEPQPRATSGGDAANGGETPHGPSGPGTAWPPVSRRTESGSDAVAARAEVVQRMTALSLIPELEPKLDVAIGKPAVAGTAKRRELSAADLEAIRWRLDGGSLREVVDDRESLRELGDRLDGPLAEESDDVVKAGLLSVRAEVYRLLGELGMAAAASRLALAHAKSAKDVQSTVIAQAELAHVLRLRGDFVEADRLFARATSANVPEALRSVVHENAGRCCFDQGRHMEALDHFARAVRLGEPDDADLGERIGVCLQAVYIHVLRDGWGPYPRRGLDAMGGRGPAQPGPDVGPADALDETTAEQQTVRQGRRFS